MGIPDYASAEFNLDPEGYWRGAQGITEEGGDNIPELASQKQVGGIHYKKFKIQPAEFCYYNNIPYLEATAIKYLCRWKDKGGIQDLEKAKHFIDLLIEFENANH